MSSPVNRVICALDTKRTPDAMALCQKIHPFVGAVKLGLEFFTANGRQGVRELAGLNIPIFLDLKFHDIPNTVAQAVRAAMELDVSILTVHTMGGVDMMKAAADAARDEAEKHSKIAPLIMGVTVLTSMNNDDLQDIGVTSTVDDQVINLACRAQAAGLDGVVCSAHELKVVKERCGRNFKAIVPGIRPASSDVNDQKRVMTPKEAVDNGADFLVIGRPITQAPDPAQAAKDILDEIF